MSDSDRNILKEVVNQQWQHNRPLLSVDKYFEIFSAEQVLKSLAFDLDTPQIESGIVGSGDDGGIDSLYLFANRRLIREDTNLADFKEQQLNIELLFIQSKHEASFTEDVIRKFVDFSDNCLKFGTDLSQASRVLYSGRLLDAVARFHAIYKPAQRPSLKIWFYYGSLGEDVHVKVTTRRDLFVQHLQQLYSTAQCTCDFAGAKALWTWFDRPATGPLVLECCESMRWPLSGKSYVGLVPLGNFYKFIDHGGNPRASLFESNVRDYHPDATVNEKIAKTLDNPGNEDFWWLNNGITIIASEAVPDGHTITITDALIVNGLQTSYEIFNHFQRATSIDDKRTVLVRVIKTSDSVSIDNIINATNSQTSIPTIWLHATEEIHRKIEVLLVRDNLYYDRRKNFYRNRGKSSGEIVTIPYLVQALVAIVLQKPDEARARPTTVAEKYYKQLFNEDVPEDIYSKSAQILKRVDRYLDGTGIDRVRRLNLVFYVAMHSVCVALKSANPRRKTIAAFDVDKLTDELLELSFFAVDSTYIELGEDDKVAKGKLLVQKVKDDLKQRFARVPGMPEPPAKQERKR